MKNEEPKPIHQQIIDLVGGEDKFKEIAGLKRKNIKTMKNKQTAVEWLEEQFRWMLEDGVDISDVFHSTIEKFNQAKAMEKEQVKRMYTEEEVYDLLVEWNMYQKGEPRVDEDEIPNGFMSFNEWFKKISKQQENEKI